MMAKPEDLPYRPCVGITLINADGLVFAGRRKDNFPEAWQMPQGGIDAGETPRAAALRELWEETGVAAGLVQPIAKTHRWITYDLPPELAGKVWGGKYRGQRQKWFALRFLGDDADIRLDLDPHPEFDAWRWAQLQELPALAVEFKRAIYEDLAREFARFGG